MNIFTRRLADDVDLAIPVVTRAIADLGRDLGGFSPVDLLADHFPWPTSWCRKVVRVLQAQKLLPHFCKCCGCETEGLEDCCSDEFPEAGDLREWA